MGLMSHGELKYATTKTELLAVPLPAKTKTYQPIGHGALIKTAEKAIRAGGFKLFGTQYMGSKGGKQMAALFNYGKRTSGKPEFVRQLALMNSYDKSIRATAAGGAGVTVCANGMTIAERFIKRKHTGDSAPSTMTDFIQKIVEQSGDTLREVKRQRKLLVGQPLSRREMAQLAGRLFVEERMLNGYELQELARQINAPSFDYGGHNNTAWEFYNHVTHAYKLATPINYMKKQREFNAFMLEEIT